jgi:predicted AlkP superfamily pyrophosphatase or phosphodiesterase
MDQRVAAFKDWLAMPEETRPHFISFYLAATDHEGHLHGPGSLEVAEAVQTIDGVVGKFDEAAKASGLPINFIFVSDHGMAAVDPKPVPFPAAAADTSKFRIFRSGGLVNVHAKNPADILPAYQALKAIQQNDYDVYLKKDAPADWHYGGKDDRFNRAGDILLMTKFPKVFGKKSPAGSHGFLPSEKEMHSAFYAWGPAFKENHRVAPFKNVEVYEVMARILGIKPLKTDATGKLAKEILK